MIHTARRLTGIVLTDLRERFTLVKSRSLNVIADCLDKLNVELYVIVTTTNSSNANRTPLRELFTCIYGNTLVL